MGRRLRLAPIPVYLARPGDHVNVPYAPCARAHRLKDRIRRPPQVDVASARAAEELDDARDGVQPILACALVVRLQPRAKKPH